MTPFNVIFCEINSNKMEAYDIMPTLINEYKRKKPKDRPSTFDEFKDFIKKESLYHWGYKCEYEIILSDWPCQKKSEKWDINMQVLMNLDLITKVLMDNVL